MSARVAVMMPAYNCEKYIKEAILSVFNQTYTDWHLYISDDGSSDRTREIIQKTVNDRDKVTILLQEQNLGNPRNRNALLKAAKDHELLAILDADDRALPERIEKQVAYFDKYSDISLLGSDIEIIDEKGEVQGIREYPRAHNQIERTLLVFDPFAQPAVMFRSSALDLVGGYDEELARCQDYDLFVRMIHSGIVSANMPEPLTGFRVFKGQGKYQNLSKALWYSFKVRSRHLFTRQGFSLRGLLMWFLYFGGSVVSTILPSSLFKNFFTKLFIRS